MAHGKALPSLPRAFPTDASSTPELVPSTRMGVKHREERASRAGQEKPHPDVPGAPARVPAAPHSRAGREQSCVQGRERKAALTLSPPLLITPLPGPSFPAHAAQRVTTSDRLFPSWEAESGKVTSHPVPQQRGRSDCAITASQKGPGSHVRGLPRPAPIQRELSSC